MNNITNLVLKNRNELFENKKKIISCRNNIKKKYICIKKINLISKKNNLQSIILKNKKKIMILKEKIKNIDPWYAKICELKKLPENVKQLAMHTSCKNTLECWYVSLLNKKKHLIQYNTWTILKKELHTITKKKIQLIIEKNKLNTLTPYEWFDNMYEKRISEEHLLLTQDPNIKILKKLFNIELQKENIDLI